MPPEPVAVSVVAFNAVFATRTTKSGEEYPKKFAADKKSTTLVEDGLPNSVTN